MKLRRKKKNEKSKSIQLNPKRPKIEDFYFYFFDFYFSIFFKFSEGIIMHFVSVELHIMTVYIFGWSRILFFGAQVGERYSVIHEVMKDHTYIQYLRLKGVTVKIFHIFPMIP